MKEDILKRIREILSEISEIDVNEVKFDSTLLELNLSSIEIMSFIAEVQRTYNIQITENELMTIETISTLVDLIEEKKK